MSARKCLAPRRHLVGTVDAPRRYVFAIHAYGNGFGTPCNPADNCGARMRQEVADFFFNLGAPLYSANFETGNLDAWAFVIP